MRPLTRCGVKRKDDSDLKRSFIRRGSAVARDKRPRLREGERTECLDLLTRRAETRPVPRFTIYLIKPTRYDDEGYPLQWRRSMVPSNSLGCLDGIVWDALERGVFAPDIGVEVVTIDEIHTHVDPAAILRHIAARGGKGFIGLVGVQSNQFPRAVDLGRAFRAAGLPVCIGGFHVSGCLSMLKQLDVSKNLAISAHF
jgi:hypothetical protein